MGLVIRAALLVLLTSCLPAPHEYVGGSCDTAHPCPGELECRANVCRIQGGAGGGAGGGGASVRDNRTPSGDFEDGMPAFNWTSPNTMTGDGQTKRSGAFSTKLSGAPAVHSLTNLAFRIDLSSDTGTFCSEAWVMGAGAATTELTLIRTLAGPVKSADRAESHATLSSTWAPVRTRIIVEPSSLDLTWELRVSQPAAETFIDDVMVWRSPDGGCAE